MHILREVAGRKSLSVFPEGAGVMGRGQHTAEMCKMMIATQFVLESGKQDTDKNRPGNVEDLAR